MHRMFLSLWLRKALEIPASWKDIQHTWFDSFILHNSHRWTWRFANWISMGVSWMEQHLQLHVALCRYHVDPFCNCPYHGNQLTRWKPLIQPNLKFWWDVDIHLYTIGVPFPWICARTHLEIVDKNGSHITQQRCIVPCDTWLTSPSVCFWMAGVTKTPSKTYWINIKLCRSFSWFLIIAV